MKKLIVIFLILVMINNLLLVGCAKNESTQSKINNEEQKNNIDNNDSKGIEVDKNLLTVDITLPESLVGDMSDFNEQEYLSGNDGIKSAKLNADGSMTLNMTKKKHNELLDDLRKNLDETFGELIESEETPYIKKIDYTKDYREVKIIVDKEKYENAFDLTPFLIGMTTGIYQLYSGQEYHTNIIILDLETREEIYSVNYPEDIGD